MAEFDFNKTYEQAEKQYNLDKGQYLKLKDGANRLRLVSACLPHDSIYNGRKTFKWLCQVIDRKDGILKPYFMPNTIYKMIMDLQMDPEYAFKEVPMPYDLTINATGAGSKEVKYSVFPARENTPLTTEEQNAITEAPTVTELQAKVREGEAKTPAQPAGEVDPAAPTPEELAQPQVPHDDINVEDIPF
jgi:hypothetical protein